MEWPATKDTARVAGLKYYQTGAACIHGHVAERLVSTGACAECNRIRSREQQRKLWAADPDAMRTKAREAYQAKPEHYRAKAREWRDDNLDKQREYERQWRKDNPEKDRESARKHRKLKADYYREYDAAWRDANRARYRAFHRRRQTLKVQACPTWLTEDQIAAMVANYEQSERLTREMGILHEVDHIIPLNHPDVCGLHVPWNLQVLPREKNRQKSNSFDGTLDNEGWRV
jgi:hypothetical protein